MNAVESQTLMAHRISGWRTGRFARWFIYSAVGILLVSAFAKIVSASGDSHALDSSDPIFPVSYRQLLLSVGFLELAVCAVCLFSGRMKLALSLIAWLASNFLLYHVGLWLMGWSGPCNCLGNLTGAIHLSSKTVETITRFLSIYLFAGSVVGILGSQKSLSPPDTVIGP